MDELWEQALGYERTRNGGLGTSGGFASTYYKTLGFSGDTASKGLFCMLGLASDVVAW